MIKAIAYTLRKLDQYDNWVIKKTSGNIRFQNGKCPELQDERHYEELAWMLVFIGIGFMVLMACFFGVVHIVDSNSGRY